MLSLLLSLIFALSTPCATEDSTGCYWDSSSHGNGAGRSYVVLEDDQIIYMTLPGQPQNFGSVKA